MRAHSFPRRRAASARTEAQHSTWADRRFVATAMAITALALLSACNDPTRPFTKPPYVPPSADIISFPEGFGYNLVDLSTWAGPSVATGINAGGTVVGYKGQPGSQTGFIRSGQTNTGIAPPSGFSNSIPTDINDDGVVVGYSDGDDYAERVGWIKLPREAPKLLNQGTCAVTSANAINNVGDVVGMCDSRPALWHSLGDLPPVMLKSLSATDPSGEATDINDAGVIVGRARSDVLGADAAVFWMNPNQPGLMSIAGATSSRASRINKNSAVAGSYNQGSAQHGFVFGFIVQTKLFSDPAWAISDKGRVVGVKPGDARAFTVSPGSMTEALLPLPGSGSSLAQDVNACGTIVGSYYNGSVIHAVKWTKPLCDP